MAYGSLVGSLGLSVPPAPAPLPTQLSLAVFFFALVCLQPLLNSYSGVYLSIGYHITAKIERGLMRNDLSKKIEFMGERTGEERRTRLNEPSDRQCESDPHMISYFGQY